MDHFKKAFFLSLFLLIFLLKTSVQAAPPSPGTVILERQAVPQWVQTTAASIVSGMYGHPRAVDVDGDGDQDFVIGDGSDPTNPLRVYLKNGNNYMHVELPSPVQGNSPAPVDWDQDGDIDLVVGSGSGPMRLFLMGSNGFSESLYPWGYNLQSINLSGTEHPFFVDWDQDGDWDIILGSLDGRVRLYLNTTSFQGYFLQDGYSGNNLNTIDVGSESYPTLVDWDNNGDLDLIVGNNLGEVRYYTNNGSNNFTQDTNFGPVNLPSTSYFAAPTVLNLDINSDLDLFVGSDTGQFFS